MTEFGLRLKRLRESKQLTQEQLAELAEIPYTTYRKYEIGSIMPRKTNMEKLEKFYRLSAEELLGIGTVITLEYDPLDIEQLQSIIDSALPNNEKIEALSEVLNRLYDQKEQALAVRGMDDIEVALYSGKRIRTVRFDEEQDQLIWRATELQQKLIMDLCENMRRGNFSKLGDKQ